MMNSILIKEELTLGDRLADKISQFMGTWWFVLATFLFLFIWIFLNSLAIFHVIRFDSYPYILLNLVLSCMACFNSPVILMSARRLERIDREIARDNYMLSIETSNDIHEIINQLKEERKISELLLKYLDFRKQSDAKISSTLEKIQLRIGESTN